MILGLGLFLATAAAAQAERLPIRTMTSSDGLAGDQVSCIVEDSRGFLWIGTTTGLSRFDGLRFTNYGTEHGLPHPTVHDVLETERGTYWVATGAGLARFEPEAGDGEPKFSVFALRPDDGEAGSTVVGDLHLDRRSGIWIGTSRGLFQLEDREGGSVFHPVELDVGVDGPVGVYAIVDDPEGSLWIGTFWGVVRLLPDGSQIHYPVQPFEGNDRIHDLAIDAHGRLWVAQWGVFVLRPVPAEEDRGPRRSLLKLAGDPPGGTPAPALPGRPGEVRYFDVGNALASNRVFSLSATADGVVRIATNAGLTVHDGQGARSYTERHGLVAEEVTAVAGDRAGNVWIGTGSSGLMRLSPRGLTTYTDLDGLRPGGVAAIFENRSGQLIVMTRQPGIGERGNPFGKPGIHRFEGNRFAGVVPGSAETIRYWGWGWNQVVLQDRTGDWWLATGEGLLRFGDVSTIEDFTTAVPKATYTTRDGLGGDEIFRFFEDSRSDIWVGTFGSRTLARWERSTGTFHAFSGLATPTAFEEDAHGTIWIGFYTGALARYRDGRLERFGEPEGAPLGFINDLHRDRAGRLWIASSRDGLTRLDDPAAARPRFRRYTTADGLSSDGVTALAEDSWGRIYAATGRGIDCLEPDGGIVRRWTAADGLASHQVPVAFRDRHGHLWFGTGQGLSRLLPTADVPADPPPVLISGLSIAGVPHPVSDLGARRIEGLHLHADQNRVRIDFLGLTLEPGEVLSYQYKLEDADRDWGPATEERSVLYANLAPGRYRFSVRAMTADGVASFRPAVVSFAIAPPVWQRGWFLALVTVAFGAALTAAHRHRLRRALELERMRTRIATDLHDDLGSGLARISVLSEVARHKADDSGGEADRVLVQIGRSARELIDVASDIVWAVDPRHDDLASLVARLRRFASDLFDGEGISWTLTTSGNIERVDLPADQRRHLWLIFKEALHNVLRHAGGSRVSIAVEARDAILRAEILDDGRGFAVAESEDGSGNGLHNMRNRARELRGRLRISSAPGRGTRLELEAPIP